MQRYCCNGKIKWKSTVWNILNVHVLITHSQLKNIKTSVIAHYTSWVHRFSSIWCITHLAHLCSSIRTLLLEWNRDSDVSLFLPCVCGRALQCGVIALSFKKKNFFLNVFMLSSRSHQSIYIELSVTLKKTTACVS